MKSSSTILIADDDPDDRLMIGEALQKCVSPTLLRYAENGVEVLNYLSQAHVDAEAARVPRPGLILLDLNMPRMGGLAALRVLKADARYKTIPVVVLTTSQSQEEREASFRAGAEQFFTKPSRFKELEDVLCGIAQTWLPKVH